MTTQNTNGTPTDSSNAEDKPAVQDQLVTTRHSITINGQLINYTVTAGTIVISEESEKTGEQAGEFEGAKPKATIFFVAYTRDDIESVRTRPLTFSFNGGPGSSSIWLHMGVFGPRRVLLDEIGNPPPPPYQLVDNEYSLLDQTDLVFIDPVSTGYSRVVSGEKAKTFYSFKKDIESVGDFIRLYISRYQRWSSPKFLAGESYGTTRASGLAGYLQQRHGLYLNGLMLISSVLNFQTIRFGTGNDLPYILYLPTYTATAWYHQQLDEELQRDLYTTLAAVEKFAMNEYTLALMKGTALSATERTHIAQQLARFTGLSVEYIERTNLRIEIHRFVKELLRDQRRTVGRLDSRFTGIDRDSAGETFEHDPSMSAITGPYAATFNDYARRELQFASDLPYEVLNFNVNRLWSFAEHENQFVDVAETLRKTMSEHPYLRVHVASGYLDLATPYFATEYTLNHLGLDPDLQSNISLSYYEAGHMMYIHLPSLAKMRESLLGFMTGDRRGE
ncbi:MAG: peptidase S10 [Chloroflexota bacterium]